MTPEDLRPGMWVTVLEPIVPEASSGEGLVREWTGDEDDDAPDFRYGWMGMQTQMGAQWYSKLFGRALNVVAIQQPILLVEILAVDHGPMCPLAKQLAFLDLRIVKLMPLSNEYVEALKASVLSSTSGSPEQRAQAESYFERLAASILASKRTT